MGKRTVIHWRNGQPVKSYYEAARPDPQRKQRRESGSANAASIIAGASLREQARHLDQNHDIARGALNTLVQNIVGPNGITVEPQPRTRDGDIHDAFARQIEQLHADWALRPEVTHQHDWPSSQRLVCRTWLRDGEVLAQKVGGVLPSLDHGTRVPFSLELIEPDFLPMDVGEVDGGRIVAGIEVNAWNRPLAFHVYKSHPGNGLLMAGGLDTKRVPADRMLHVRLVDRIGQLRGVSVFASVLLRLDDIKDYEESERIAAKVAASMAAYIKKGSPDMYDPDADPMEPRNMRFRAGMVFDNLELGEEIGTIDTKRPSAQLEPFRNGQLRAASSGLHLTYSSLSKDYNGTYSAQRQELVEGYGAYGILANEFIGQFVRPVYHSVLEWGISSGQLVIPKDVDPLTLGDALFTPPQMPWIDPKKEAESFALLEDRNYLSGPEAVRKGGRVPRDVLDQQARWRRAKSERGLITGDVTPQNSMEQGNAADQQTA